MSGLYVPATPIFYEPPLHGLLDSIDELGVDERGVGHGIQLRAEMCGTTSPWDPLCAYWPEGVKPTISTQQSGLQISEHAPGVFYTGFVCDAGPRADMENLNRIAAAQLEVGRSKAVETLLWEGSDDILNPDFLSLAGTAVTGIATALQYSQGLSAAGQYLANCSFGARGMIHAPVYVVDQWLQDGSIREDARGRLVTMSRGDVVVAGSGYTGSGPTGVATPGSNEAWIYTSGPVQYKLGDIEVVSERIEENLDRSNNTYEVRAQQEVVFGFDECCVFGILVAC